MKELSIEEKAKAYDEAFRIAQELYSSPNSSNIGKGYVCTIFPELHKSDDERIKKNLREFLLDAPAEDTVSHHLDIEETLAWLEKQSTPQVRTGLEWVNTIDDACDKRYAEEYAHGEYCHEQSFKWGFQEGVDWLEKQGEPTDINPSEFDLRLNKLLKQFETLPKEELASSLSFYLNVVQNDGTYREEKQGEQKPIWTDNDRTMAFTLLRDVDQMTYISKEGKNERLQWLNSLEEKFTRKEKPADKVEDEEYNGEDYGIDSLYHAQRILEKTLGKVNGYQTDDGILEHKCAISAVKKLYEQKPAELSQSEVTKTSDQVWSEEDERNWNNIWDVLDGRFELSDYGYKEAAEWFSKNCPKGFKFLKPQNHWKPTKEQMEALHDLNLTGNISYAGQGQILIELYKQLEKL